MGRQRKIQLDESKYSHRLAISIRARRERAGLTPEELANAVGVARSAVFAWESAAYLPKYDLLPDIAGALGVKVKTLLPDE